MNAKKKAEPIARLPVKLRRFDLWGGRAPAPLTGWIDFCPLDNWFAVPKGVTEGDIVILSKPDGRYAYRVAVGSNVYSPDWNVQLTNKTWMILYTSFEQYLTLVTKDGREAWVAFECYDE